MTAVSVEGAPAAHVAVARQPILDRTESITGYELLYRSTHAVPASLDADGATSKVIVRALADIGLDRLVGDRLAWVDVTREFLLGVRPLPLRRRLGAADGPRRSRQGRHPGPRRPRPRGRRRPPARLGRDATRREGRVARGVRRVP